MSFLYAAYICIYRPPLVYVGCRPTIQWLFTLQCLSFRSCSLECRVAGALVQYRPSFLVNHVHD